VCVCVCVYTVYRELGIIIIMCSRQMRDHCSFPIGGNFFLVLCIQMDSGAYELLSSLGTRGFLSLWGLMVGT